MAIRTITPREVLAEMGKAKRKPWWVTKLTKDIENRLIVARLIDTPMSYSAVDAVIEEAIDAEMAPAQGDPIEQMIREMYARQQMN